MSTQNIFKKWWVRKHLQFCAVFLKEFFEKVDFEKYQQTTKNMQNQPACKELPQYGTSMLSH